METQTGVPKMLNYETDSNGEATHSDFNKTVLVNAGWAYFSEMDRGATGNGWAKSQTAPRFTIGSALQIARSDAYYASRAA
jgi:hypothetical protein